MRRRAAAFVALLAALVCASPVFAHSRLVEAFPADGDVLSEAPGQIQLRFNEPVEAEFEPVEVLDEDNERVDLGNAGTDPEDPEVVVVDLEEDLPGGSYTVDWRVTSEDGHPIGGTYAFELSSAPDTSSDSPEERMPVERASEESEPGGFPTGLVLGVLVAGAVVSVGFVVLRRH